MGCFSLPGMGRMAAPSPSLAPKPEGLEVLELLTDDDGDSVPVLTLDVDDSEPSEPEPEDSDEEEAEPGSAYHLSTPATSPSPGPSVKEEDKYVKPVVEQDGPRDIRSKAPHAEVKACVKKAEDDDKKDVKPKVKPEEPTEEELKEAWDNQDDRPDYLCRPGFNLLDADTYALIPELNPQDPSIARLCQEPTFKRKHLGGPPQDTIWHYNADVGKRQAAGYTTTRLCLLKELQLGIGTPGKPFVRTTSVHDWKASLDKDDAVFVRLKANPAAWAAFGLYKTVYSGRALDGEFNSLPGHKQRSIIDIMLKYLKAKNTSFTPFLFGECFIPDPNTDEPRPILEMYKSVSDDACRSFIRGWLEDNTGLRIGYDLSVYAGDNEDELAKCRAVSDAS
ncbi:hypothetical protein JCM11641_000433 [Rhodosporidiobolus odoratus]